MVEKASDSTHTSLRGVFLLVAVLLVPPLFTLWTVTTAGVQFFQLERRRSASYVGLTQDFCFLSFLAWLWFSPSALGLQWKAILDLFLTSVGVNICICTFISDLLLYEDSKTLL